MRLDLSTSVTLAVFGTQIFLTAEQVESISIFIYTEISTRMNYPLPHYSLFAFKVFLSLIAMIALAFTTYILLSLASYFFLNKRVFTSSMKAFSVLIEREAPIIENLSSSVKNFVINTSTTSKNFEQKRSRLEYEVLTRLKIILMESRSIISTSICDPGIRLSLLVPKSDDKFALISAFYLRHFLFINEHGLDSRISDDVQFAYGEGLAGLAWSSKCMQFGSPFLLSFRFIKIRNPRYKFLFHENVDNIKSLFCIPITNRKEQNIGVIAFDSTFSRDLGSKAKLDLAYKQVIPDLAHNVGKLIVLLQLLRDDIQFPPAPPLHLSTGQPSSVWELMWKPFASQ